MAKPLTKAQAVAKANAIKLANPDFPPAKIKAIIEKQNGPLVFDGEPFYFKPTGKGKLAIESVAVRNARKRRANSTRNQEIRRRTPTQREFIDRSKTFFEENNLQRLDGKTARQYGIDQHRKAKEALSIEKTRISDTGLSAGHIDPVAGGNTLERPGNYFAQPGQENFTDRNRVPTSRQQEALQTRLPREEAIDRTMGFGQDLPEFTDQQIDATLKGKGAPLGGVKQTVSLSPSRGFVRLIKNAARFIPSPIDDIPLAAAAGTFVAGAALLSGANPAEAGEAFGSTAVDVITDPASSTPGTGERLYPDGMERYSPEGIERARQEQEDAFQQNIVQPTKSFLNSVGGYINFGAAGF